MLVSYIVEYKNSANTNRIDRIYTPRIVCEPTNPVIAARKNTHKHTAATNNINTNSSPFSVLPSHAILLSRKYIFIQ